MEAGFTGGRLASPLAGILASFAAGESAIRATCGPAGKQAFMLP